uniref:PUB domain-containing protein n=1 Tax=Chenopodium quinoa TaxID=63459 RepID=A0A803LNN1_CHEQI
MEAKKTAEENARKRMIALREAEKEEESKAREKIRQKFEADKAERRSRLGISPAATSSVQSASTASHMVLKKATEDEDARVKKAFQILPIYIRNVVKNPDVEKYRKIRLSNPIFQIALGVLIQHNLDMGGLRKIGKYGTCKGDDKDIAEA